MDDNGSNSRKMTMTTPPQNCISISKNNLFEIPHSSENLFATKSIENEGDYIFSGRVTEYYYNYKDAKELEYQFNQIQKNIIN